MSFPCCMVPSPLDCHTTRSLLGCPVLSVSKVDAYSTKAKIHKKSRHKALLSSALKFRNIRIWRPRPHASDAPSSLHSIPRFPLLFLHPYQLPLGTALASTTVLRMSNSCYLTLTSWLSRNVGSGLLNMMNSHDKCLTPDSTFHRDSILLSLLPANSILIMGDLNCHTGNLGGSRGNDVPNPRGIMYCHSLLLPSLPSLVVQFTQIPVVYLLLIMPLATLLLPFFCFLAPR